MKWKWRPLEFILVPAAASLPKLIMFYFSAYICQCSSKHEQICRNGLLFSEQVPTTCVIDWMPCAIEAGTWSASVILIRRVSTIRARIGLLNQVLLLLVHSWCSLDASFPFSFSASVVSAQRVANVVPVISSCNSASLLACSALLRQQWMCNLGKEAEGTIHLALNCFLLVLTLADTHQLIHVVPFHSSIEQWLVQRHSALHHPSALFSVVWLSKRPTLVTNHSHSTLS